ncbi:hypothetical protein LTR85_009296 [Meristemomyces frigidus]|nr:hypothetical protein LTR85_009296 [Meristemomyces frigidus]
MTAHSKDISTHDSEGPEFIRFLQGVVSSDVNAFQHEALPTTEFHIRILTVHPAPVEKGPIVCNIATVELDSADGYAALSYSNGMDADGDASLCREMTLNGKRKPITRNLFEGLLRIRSRKDPLPIWIDAVCIDQLDAVERSDQVAHMADIYRNASLVIVWLGEGSSHQFDLMFHAIFERCQELAEEGYGWDIRTPADYWALIHAVLHGGHESDCPGRLFDGAHTCSLLRLDTKVEPDMLERTLAEALEKEPELLDRLIEIHLALRAFLERRYWSRRWIAQECANAEHTVWFWGPCHLWLGGKTFDSGHWNLYNACIKILVVFRLITEDPHFAKNERHHRYYRGWGKTLRMLQDVRDLHRSEFAHSTAQKGHLRNICSALTTYTAMQCSDARDYLYSLISLERNSPLIPDYRRSAADVYIEFARSLVEAGLPHAVLHNYRCAISAEDDLHRSLPSWVPDLRLQMKFHDDIWNLDTPLEAAVSQDGRTLICTLPIMGFINKTQPDILYMGGALCEVFDLCSLRETIAVCGLRGTSVAVREEIDISPHEGEESLANLIDCELSTQPETHVIEPGDLLCALKVAFRPTEATPYPQILLLRFGIRQKDSYSIVRSFRSSQGLYRLSPTGLQDVTGSLVIGTATIRIV